MVMVPALVGFPAVKLMNLALANDSFVLPKLIKMMKVQAAIPGGSKTALLPQRTSSYHG